MSDEELSSSGDDVRAMAKCRQTFATRRACEAAACTLLDRILAQCAFETDGSVVARLRRAVHAAELVALWRCPEKNVERAISDWCFDSVRVRCIEYGQGLLTGRLEFVVARSDASEWAAEPEAVPVDQQV